MSLSKRLRILVEPPSNITNFLQSKRLTKFIAGIPDGKLIVDIGSGRNKFSDRCVGVDIVEAKDVDVLGNIHDLPFLNSSLDAVVVRGVLEHTELPEEAVNEIERVLKTGGMVFSSIPFMQAYHPSPGDYQRYTIDGIERLFSRFEKIDCSITRGAGSSFVWIGREFFSQLLSFNSLTIYKILKVIFGWIMQPIKYADLLLNNHRMAHVAASGFTFIGRKLG